MKMIATAAEAALPNPFLSDPLDDVRRAGPPMRPPPPHSASPAHAGLAQAPRTAFDDLNESIQLAMGHSPAKQPAAPALIGSVGYQQPMQPMPTAAGYGVAAQQPYFASPSKQPPSTTGQH